MSPRLVYVAAPLAPWKARPPGASEYLTIEQFEHVKRANKIARAALEAGFAPILVHNDVRAGVFGSDDVDADRERGIACCVATVEAVARAGGELWLLLLPDGTASHGCHTERAAFSRAGGLGIRLWRLVRFGADEHETPVCVGTVGIYGPGVVTRGRPEAARTGALPERFASDYEEPPINGAANRCQRCGAGSFDSLCVACVEADRKTTERVRDAVAPRNRCERHGGTYRRTSCEVCMGFVTDLSAIYPRVVKCDWCDKPFTANTEADRYCDAQCAYEHGAS